VSASSRTYSARTWAGRSRSSARSSIRALSTFAASRWSNSRAASSVLFVRTKAEVNRMRMFRRRSRDDDDQGTNARTSRPATATTDGRAYADDGAKPGEMDNGRRWHHGPTRALVTLLAAGIAGLLAWTTTNINDSSTGGYWAVYGILAGAGLVLALSQVFGG